MFTRVSDASKTAFATFARHFFEEMKGSIIDSQVYTDHMARFGGINISRSAYLRKLRDGLYDRGPNVCCEAADVADAIDDAHAVDAADDSIILHQGLWQPDFLTRSAE